MGTITVIGSLNMDLVVRSAKIPRPGETLAGSDFHLIPGGKGANQAVAAARAGAATAMVGCLGADAFAPVLLESLIAAGVDTRGVARLAGISTGTATILLEEGGENRIIIVAGANGQVSEEVVNANWEQIAQSDLILLQHEIPLSTVHAVIARAHSEGIRVLLNPAPIYPIPLQILAQVDTLILNEIEASFLTGSPVSDPHSAAQAAAKLVTLGVQTAIITLGPQGALLFSSAGGEMYQPAFQVTPIDTTAAGDTFVGGYAASLLAGASPAEALRYAAAAAALAVTRLGAQTSIPARAEVEAFLAEQLSN